MALYCQRLHTPSRCISPTITYKHGNAGDFNTFDFCDHYIYIYSLLCTVGCMCAVRLQIESCVYTLAYMNHSLMHAITANPCFWHILNTELWWNQVLPESMSVTDCNSSHFHWSSRRCRHQSACVGYYQALQPDELK